MYDDRIAAKRSDETTITIWVSTDDLVSMHQDSVTLWGRRSNGVLDDKLLWSKKPPGIGWKEIATVANYLNAHERMSFDSLLRMKGKRLSLTIPRFTLVLGANDRIVEDNNEIWVYRNHAPLTRVYTGSFNRPDEVMWADDFLPLNVKREDRTLFVPTKNLRMFDIEKK